MNQSKMLGINMTQMNPTKGDLDRELQDICGTAYYI